jgi:hypothetical protein
LVLLPVPQPPGTTFKALDQDGYDDGGVGDLMLIVDLDDRVLRRKWGDNAYFSAVKTDVVPRITNGKMASSTRRDQKLELAKLLFSDYDEKLDDNTSSEVFVEVFDSELDDVQLKRRTVRLQSAKYALKLSMLLKEPACASLALCEISKRYLALRGKNGAEDALRTARKAVEITTDGFYDNDDIDLEVSRYCLQSQYRKLYDHN